MRTGPSYFRENWPSFAVLAAPAALGTTAGAIAGPFHPAWFLLIPVVMALWVPAAYAYSVHVHDRCGQPLALIAFIAAMAGMGVAFWLLFLTGGLAK